jgi:hypothetical protein
LSKLSLAILGLIGITLAALTTAALMPESLKELSPQAIQSKWILLDLPKATANEIRAAAATCNSEVKNVRTEILNPFLNGKAEENNHVSASFVIDKLMSKKNHATKACKKAQKAIDTLDSNFQDEFMDEKFIADLNLYLFEQMVSIVSARQIEFYWRDFSEKMSEVEKIYFNDKVITQHQKQIEILVEREKSLQSNLGNCIKYKNNKAVTEQMEKFSNTTAAINQGFEAIKYTVEQSLRSNQKSPNTGGIPNRSVASVVAN